MDSFFGSLFSLNVHRRLYALVIKIVCFFLLMCTGTLLARDQQAPPRRILSATSSKKEMTLAVRTAGQMTVMLMWMMRNMSEKGRTIIDLTFPMKKHLPSFSEGSGQRSFPEWSLQIAETKVNHIVTCLAVSTKTFLRGEWRGAEVNMYKTWRERMLSTAWRGISYSTAPDMGQGTDRECSKPLNSSPKCASTRVGSDVFCEDGRIDLLTQAVMDSGIHSDDGDMNSFGDTDLNDNDLNEDDDDDETESVGCGKTLIDQCFAWDFCEMDTCVGGWIDDEEKMSAMKDIFGTSFDKDMSESEDECVKVKDCVGGTCCFVCDVDLLKGKCECVDGLIAKQEKN